MLLAAWALDKGDVRRNLACLGKLFKLGVGNNVFNLTITKMFILRNISRFLASRKHHSTDFDSIGVEIRIFF